MERGKGKYLIYNFLKGEKVVENDRIKNRNDESRAELVPSPINSLLDVRLRPHNKSQLALEPLSTSFPKSNTDCNWICPPGRFHLSLTDNTTDSLILSGV